MKKGKAYLVEHNYRDKLMDAMVDNDIEIIQDLVSTGKVIPLDGDVELTEDCEPTFTAKLKRK